MSDDCETQQTQPAAVWHLAYAERPEYRLGEVRDTVWEYDRKLNDLGLDCIGNHVYLLRGHNTLFLGKVYEESMRNGYDEKTWPCKPVVALSLNSKAKRQVESALDCYYDNLGATPEDRAILDRLVLKAQRKALALQGTLEVVYGAGDPVGEYPPDHLLMRAGIYRYDDVVF